MSATGNAPVDPGALDLPPYSMDVETLDLGTGTQAVGLELLETESREPVKGKEAAAIWAAALPALANNDGFALDFFAHVDRVKEFCKMYDIHYREAAERCVVLRAPAETQLQELFERFDIDHIDFEFERTSKNGPAEEFLSTILGEAPTQGSRLSREQFVKSSIETFQKVLEVVNG